MDLKTLWKIVLTDLELQVSKAVYKTLLSQTQLISYENNTAVISCHQPMFINLIEKRYHDLIKKTVDTYTKANNTLVFTAQHETAKKPIDGPLFTMPVPNTTITPTSSVRLNPDYTFDNFAVSSSNQMAYAAATAVSKSPGTSYNPLFLYGGVGVGKTHLMQGIGHKVLNQKPRTSIIFCTGEEFTNEIIEAISNKTTTRFKKKYRHVDMLLIDDVQFIAGKYSIQEEFFHTFNAIQQAKGQIILTSDRPPEEIDKLEARLKSRFEGGLTIDIGQPDFELRTAILLIKAKQKGIELPIELAKTIAANTENPRKLNGILIRIITEAETRRIPIDIELVKNVLGKTVKESTGKTTLTAEQVINTIASYYQIKLSQLKGDKRDRCFALPRQILYYLLKNEVGMSLIQIGDILGGRDHTTILHGIRKINTLISTDKKIQEDILGIKEKIS